MKLTKEQILKEIKKHYNFEKDADFARFLEIRPQVLSNWYARNTFDHGIIYTKCLDVSTDWLFTGKGEMLKSNNIVSETRNNQGIPLIPIEAMAGYGKDDTQVMEHEIDALYKIPDFENKGVKFLIRASGSSMYPKYSNGDILACRPITDTSFFQWGKVYVLDTEQGPLVKRLFPCKDDDECLECHSDNKEYYPPFPIRKQSIRKVSIVVGVVRLE